MKDETPEQEFYRLRDQIQNMVLTGYPNPDRVGCPGLRTIENLAKVTSSLLEKAKPAEESSLVCSTS
jgi:hypothetical protein